MAAQSVVAVVVVAAGFVAVEVVVVAEVAVFVVEAVVDKSPVAVEYHFH